MTLTTQLTPALQELAKFVAEMPGGQYIGQHWLTEDRVLVGVEITDIEHSSGTLELIRNAYPPRCDKGDITRWIGTYLFHVPLTVAKILEHYPISSTDVEGIDTFVLTLPEEQVEETVGEIDDTTLDLLMELWTPHSLMDFKLETMLERHKDLQHAARMTGHSLDEVWEVVRCLWKDEKRSFEAAIEAAEALLS